MNMETVIQEKYTVALDNENKEALIIKHYSLIKYIAQRLSRIFPKHIEIDSLIQAGIIGFLRAIDNYDDRRGAKFTTFATICIKGAILEELRTLDWATRSVRQKANKIKKAFEELERNNNTSPCDEEISVQLGVPVSKYHDMLNEVNAACIVSLEGLKTNNQNSGNNNILDVIKNFGTPDPEMLIIIKEQAKILGKLIDELAEKERMVITLYYYEELTMKEIGEVLNITESRVSQLHNSAILKIQYRLNKVENVNINQVIPLKFINEPIDRKISWLIYGLIFLQLLGCSSKKQVKINTSPQKWSVMVFPLNYTSHNSEINNQVSRLLSEELNQKWGNVINYHYSNQQLLVMNKKNGLCLQDLINDLYMVNNSVNTDRLSSFIPSSVKAIIVIDVFSYTYYWNDYKKMVKIGIKLKIFDTNAYNSVWENVVLENLKEEDGGIEQATRISVKRIIDLMDIEKISFLVNPIEVKDGYGTN